MQREFPSCAEGEVWPDECPSCVEGEMWPDEFFSGEGEMWQRGTDCLISVEVVIWLYPLWMCWYCVWHNHFCRLKVIEILFAHANSLDWNQKNPTFIDFLNNQYPITSCVFSSGKIAGSHADGLHAWEMSCCRITYLGDVMLPDYMPGRCHEHDYMPGKCIADRHTKC